jgi:hypothetical protein
MNPTEYILKRRGAKKFKNAKHQNMRMSLMEVNGTHTGKCLNETPCTINEC